MYTLIGSNTYAAPEILREEAYHGADVDIFAYGVTILTLRTMRYPFAHARWGDPDYDKLAGGNSTQFWSTYNGLSKEFEDLCTSILRDKPTDRIEICDIFMHPWMNSNDVASSM